MELLLELLHNDCLQKSQQPSRKRSLSAYITELTLKQYELLGSLLLPEAATDRPRTVDLMSVIQKILFILVNGCAWRLLPKEYSPDSTVYYYYNYL
ncbi:hypothetical protein NIES593_21505 [Hydrococcus rivularis NIES-593]|uniref:Insertion element IS402-like domain-containing protein n=1 Tax=Hydrococcus rivularis NIES-593 TaxID=1921803 RepID=A0A1U7H815_9CYAN|nr:transposase [Hydrococcus rivularis]OKH18983.1 hypothetical protein NIES593_21505 [Hydrococcus rivularis NIES-593]